MSKSFDEQIKARLVGFNEEPPAGARERILDAVAAPEGTQAIYWQSLAGGLLLLALFQMGYQPSQIHTETSIASAREEAASSPSSAPKLVGTESGTASLEVYRSEPSEVEVIPALEETGSSAGNRPVLVSEHSEDVRYQRFFIDPFGPNAHANFNASRNLSGHLAIKRERKRIIPIKEPLVRPYYNLGAFFVYNRVNPDLTDDIYVGTYEAPFSLSAARIGGTAEFGVQRDWSERVAMRLGLSINNFSQNYSFSLRGITPDSVSVNAADGYLEPHFDTEQVQISERVTMAGARVQTLWSMFHSKTDRLFLSLEYQRVLGKGPSFTYEGTNHYLMRTTQLLMEVGLHKTLMETRKGRLYAQPGLRYMVNRFESDEIISVKPFSVGITISYGIK